MKKALITGITGQDGSLLARLLLNNGYEVYGIVRRASSPNLWRLDDLCITRAIHFIDGDLLDETSLINAMKCSMPDEVYHLAAQSFVGTSWKQPILTSEVTGIGTLRMLEAVRQVKPDTKFYFAGSSEMFGKVQQTPQTETTPFYPRSPYGVSKVYGYWITKNYRESYNMFCSCGILYNHESEYRGPEFVTQKIANAAARINLGLQDELRLGNLKSKRDFGYAPDYVEAMWQMMQLDCPDDFVIATGEMYSIREFCREAFSYLGLDYNDYVVIDPEFYRPAEVSTLLGDAQKAFKAFGWKPKTNFKQLVSIIVDAAVDRALLECGS